MKLDTAANGWHPSFTVSGQKNTVDKYCLKIQLRNMVEKYTKGDAGMEEFREWRG